MSVNRKAMAVLGALVLGLSQAAASRPAQQPGCEVLAHNDNEWATCLAVEVKLRGLPRVGEQAEVDVVVTASADRQDVDILVELPGHLVWVQPPSGMSVRDSRSRAPEDHRGVRRLGTTRSVKAHRPLVLSGRVMAVAAGSAQIRAHAATVAPEVSSHSAFLSIGHDRTVAGFAAVTDDSAVPMTGGAPTQAYPRHPVKPAGASTSPANACATGSFGYVDTGGVNRMAANIGVRVWDAGNDSVLASGVTDDVGAFRLCFTGASSVYVTFETDNSQWIIRHTSTRAAFRFRTETVAASAASFGARMPGNPLLMRAVQAFDQVGAGWNWTPGQCWDAHDAVCRKALINWAPDATLGTWYDLNENAVFLLADDPRSAELVLHEFGHLIMDDVYEEAFPPSPKCNPHYIPRTSSRGCAWTEGFATLYEVMVLGEPIFRWADGRTLDVEQPTWGTEGWDDGDRVEGRVLGALIDLYDSNNEGTHDRCTEDPRATIWTTFLNHRSTTFAQFWSHRAEDGFDVSRTALDCLYQNTIRYR